MRRHRVGRGAVLGEALVAFAKANREVPTLTAYIAGGMTDPADRHHWRVVLKHGIAQRRRALAPGPSVERAPFDVALRALQDALPPDESVHSVAGFVVFATGAGAVLALALDTKPTASVTWQTGPRIAPCLALAVPPPAVIAIADRKHATLARLEGGALLAKERLDVEPVVEAGTHMGAAPRRGFHTGTRGETQHDAAERKLRESRERHAEHVAARLAVLADGEADVVIGGVDETVALIVAALPASFDGRVARDGGLTVALGEAGIIACAERALRALESVRQADFAGALLDAAGANGHAAAGVPDVIRALEQRAVDHLLVSPSLIRLHPQALDQIVQESLAEGAVIEVALDEAANVIDADAEGIVARLRFPVPTTRSAPSRRGPRRAAQTDARVSAS